MAFGPTHGPPKSPIIAYATGGVQPRPPARPRKLLEPYETLFSKKRSIIPPPQASRVLRSPHQHKAFIAAQGCWYATKPRSAGTVHPRTSCSYIYEVPLVSSNNPVQFCGTQSARMKSIILGAPETGRSVTYDRDQAKIDSARPVVMLSRLRHPPPPPAPLFPPSLTAAPPNRELLTAFRAWYKQRLPGRWKPGVFFPDIVGIRGSTVLRYTAMHDINTLHPPPPPRLPHPYLYANPHHNAANIVFSTSPHLL